MSENLHRRDSRLASLKKQQDMQFAEIQKQEASLVAESIVSKLPETGKRSHDGTYQVKDSETHVVKIISQDNQVKAVFKQLFAGGGAGAITKTSVAPLERIKILLQVQGMKSQMGEKKYKGIFGTFQTVVKEEGLLSLYRGNGANVIRVVPVYALKFTFNDTFKDMVRVPGKPLNFTQLILSGTLAGLFQTCMTYPLETIRTRLTMGPSMGMHYTGIVDVARKTLRNEGVAGLYKGIVPTFLSGSPYVGLQMTFYEIFSRNLKLREDKPTSMAHTIWIQLEKLSSGAAAGLIAQTLTYPGDTVRRRMQMDGVNGIPRIYTGMLDCCQKIIKREGTIAMFNGWGANSVRALPGAAIQFWAYDFLNSLVREL